MRALAISILALTLAVSADEGCSQQLSPAACERYFPDAESPNARGYTCGCVDPADCAARNCTRWAYYIADQYAGTAYGTCLYPNDAGIGCARANICSDPNDPASCRCGNGPACPIGYSCWTPDRDTTPTCVCSPE